MMSPTTSIGASGIGSSSHWAGDYLPLANLDDRRSGSTLSSVFGDLDRSHGSVGRVGRQAIGVRRSCDRMSVMVADGDPSIETSISTGSSSSAVRERTEMRRAPCRPARRTAQRDVMSCLVGR